MGRAIVDHLFPEGDAGRIPIVGVTGTNGKTVVARLIARLLYLSGKRTGLACSEGLYLDRRLVQKGDRADFASGTRVLMNRNVDAAVIENDSSVILGQGLAYDRCQVGVVTNIDDADHLGDFDINDAERMFNVFRTQVDGAARRLHGAERARSARGRNGRAVRRRRDLLRHRPALPAIAAHLQQDGRAVFVRDGAIVLAQGPRQERLADVAAIPLTHGGRVAFQVENVLAAVGAAWALDIPVELIRAGIETFDIDQADAPWQFTLFERGGSTVVVDDAHNASALRPLIAAIDQFPATARCAVYSAGADRRDADLIEQGKLLGDAFDRVVLYDDATVRSKRPEGQARALLRQGLAQGSRVKHRGRTRPRQGHRRRAGRHRHRRLRPAAVGRSLLRPHHRSGPPLDPATRHHPARPDRGAPEPDRQEYLPWKFPASEAARPQSVEQEHGDRGHRVLRRRRVLHRQPPRLRGAAARPPQTGLLRPEGHQGAVSIAHVLQIVSLTMQAHAGCPVTFGRTSTTIEPGVFQVVVEYSEEEVGRLAMELAQQLVRAALDDTPFDLPDALKRLRELDEDVRLGPSTGSIVNAATARGIPYRRLTQGSMVQFGWGSKQRRIQAAETDLTSAISESIAQDKDLTKMLLDAAGVPVPLGRSVTSAEAAWEAAQELGGPVVVAARRQPGSWRGRQHRDARTRDPGLRSGRGNQLGSHRRALHPRP